MHAGRQASVRRREQSAQTGANRYEDEHGQHATLTWIRVVAPAEDALVRAGKGWRGFHASMALDAIERVLHRDQPEQRRGGAGDK